MKRAQRKAEKPDARGGTYLLLPHCLLTSAAFRTASPRAVKVLLAICLKHNGFNNGRIAMSARDLAVAVDCQNHAANGEALAECILRGFLALESDFPKGKRLAREYRITFVPTERASATHDYLSWEVGDAGTRAKVSPPRGNKRVVATATVEPVSVVATATVAKQTVVATSTAETLNGENPPILESASVVATATHIVSQSRPSSAIQSKFRPDSGGPLSSAPEAEELRARTKALLSNVGRGWQNKLAAQADIPAGTLSKFLNRGAPLDDRARIRLTCAMPRTEAAAARG